MSMADVTNAEIMGGMFGPNPFSQFPGRVPQPGYVGMPTDAMGKPIAPPPGVTLNSVPAAAQQAPAAPQTSPGAGYFQGGPGSLALGSQIAPAGSLPGIQALYGRNFAGGAPPAGTPLASGSIYGSALGGGSPSAGSGAPAQPAGTGSLDNALSLLANPGHVTTPGANVPESPPSGSNPSVLSQFLANQGGGTGAGGYSNKGFFDTLNALKSGGSPPPSSDLTPNPGMSLSSAMAPVSAPGAASTAGNMPAHQFGDPGNQSGWMAPVANPLALAMAQTGGLGGLGGMPLLGGRTPAPVQSDLGRFAPLTGQEQPYVHGGDAGTGSM